MGKRRAGGQSSSSSKRRKKSKEDVKGEKMESDEKQSKVSELSLLEPQRKKLFELLDRCLSHQENTSALLVGARGSGKQKVLTHVLNELSETHEVSSFLPVYLNGFLQSDDTTAMRVMCREISRKLDTKDDEVIRKGSFAENLIYLREALQRAKKKKICIFFILDEFDLFANRMKQTLLYNLYNSLHDQGAQLALIGITTHQNVFELLEKRIRSRFSQRTILFTGGMTFPEVQEIMKAEFSETILGKSLNRIYNNKIVKKALQLHYDCGKSLSWFRNLHVTAISRLPENTKQVSPEEFISSLRYFTSDSKLHALKDCSIMEIVLLVAMSSLEFKDMAPCSFAHVYHEYEQCHEHSALVKRHHYPRNVARKGFERLIDGCLISDAGGARNLSQLTSKEYRQYHLAIDPDIVVSSVKNEMKDDIPGWVRQWITRR